MTLVLPVERPRAAPGAWPLQGALLALTAAALLALFAADAAAMVTTWWTSTTFQHCFVVLAILAWLVGQRRRELEMLKPVGWWPGLLIVAAGGVAWLAGAAGAVTVARQLGLVVMLQGAAVTLLGPAVARGLLFPLGYALFLVPFGEWMEPPLQAVTVRLALPLLHLVGVAATADGVLVHAGPYWFEVAEACSGAKFVIAMVAVGVLVAQLCFASWRRRAVFLAACVAVPVLANGVRAAATMALAQVVGPETTAGIDHIVYGWLWFALVMAAVLGVAWRWFDRPAGALAFDPERLRGRPTRRLAPAAAALLVVAVAGGFAAWGRAALARPTPLPATLALAPVPGWRLLPSGQATWRPFYPGADRRLIGRYRDAAGDTVDLAVAVFAGQGEGRNLVAYGTGAVGQGAWRRVTDLPPIAGAATMRIAAPGMPERVVTTGYAVGWTRTASPVTVKLATLRAHLFGGLQVALAVHLSAEANGRDPRAAIARFAAALPDTPVEAR